MTPPTSPTVSRRQALRIFAAAGITLATGAALTEAILRRAGLHRYSRTEIRMGTPVTIVAMHPEPSVAQTMVELAFVEMARLEGILSRYRPEGPLARLEALGTLSKPPTELVSVLRAAREISEASGGAFDVTVGPLLRLYQRANGGAGFTSPSAEELRAALALVDYRRLHVGEDAIVLERSGMHLTLDGIAKGYILDATVVLLRGEGAERVLVEAGGDLGTAGGPGESEGWTVGIRDPRNPGRSLGVLHPLGEGVATSGDYIHTFTADRRLHHILDPRTGTSPPETAAVTVIAGGAMEADALSTAAFVLGPTQGSRFIEGRDGASGLWIDKEGRETRSAGFPLGPA